MTTKQRNSFFRHRCDGCGQEIFLWVSSERAAWTRIEQAGWQIEKGNDLCPGCLAAQREAGGERDRLMPLIFGSEEANQILRQDNKTWAFYAQLLGELPSPHESAGGMQMHVWGHAEDYPDTKGDMGFCAVCGGYMDFISCWNCGGEGEFDLYDEDPIYYDEGDTEICEECEGAGGHWVCASLPHDEGAEHA